MNKKGVELSMNVIIIAILGLLVLVVLSMIFLNKIGTFGQKAGDCELQGGKCALECGNVDFGTEAFAKQTALWKCPVQADEQLVCCLPIVID